MIASLTGRLARKATDYLVVDVAGVGYHVFAPLSTYYGIPDAGEDVTLHIHTHVREDSIALFGFFTEAEKDMFLLLMGVSGIGPRLALAVLSSLSVADIASAIRTSDDTRLRAVPGIGRKTAARMALELQDKIKAFVSAGTPSDSADTFDHLDDAVSALVNLGYKKPVAEEALKKARGGRSGLMLEDLIREALQLLMKR